MKSISQIRRSSFPSHFCKTENCLRSSKFEIPWQSFTCAPTAVALFSSTRPPGFNPYMGREERRVQGLDYKQQCVTLFFLCKHTNDDVFDDFPKIFQMLLSISWTFANIFRRLPLTTDEDLKIFSSCTVEVLLTGQKKNVIKNHIFTCDDTLFLSVGYYSVYPNFYTIREILNVQLRSLYETCLINN